MDPESPKSPAAFPPAAGSPSEGAAALAAVPPSVVAVVETAREPMLVLDAGGRVLAANGAFCETFRLDADCTVGRRIHDLGQGEWDGADLRRLLEELLPARGVVVGHRIGREPGSRRLLVNGRVLAGDAAAATLVLLAFEDETERLAMEKRLRVAERRLRAMYAALPLPTAAWQREGDDFVLLDFNEAAARVSMGRMYDRVGSRLTEYYAGVPSIVASVHAVACDPGRTIREEIDYTYRSTGEHRRMVFTSVAATPDLVLVYAEDLTEQRQAEALFRGISEQAITGIYLFQDDRFVYANPRLAEMLGYTVEELHAQRGWRWVVHPSSHDVVEESMRARLDRCGTQSFFSYRAVRKDGSLVDLEIHGTSIVYGGRPALLGTVLDVSERRQLEEQLRQAQKMEAVGRLAGGVAHDFNNLLTIMKMNVAFLLEELDANDPRRAEVVEVDRSANRATALVRQLLAFSRRQVLKPRELDLNVTITDMCRMLGRLIGEDIELRLELHEGLGHVMADPGQIEQVIVNVAVNARDAMPRGGRLTIATADVVVREQYRQMPPGAYVLLTIVDTGHGMDVATLERIFDPFFTTKAPGKGTGLGLATVYGIVKQSDGFVWARSEPGRGTTLEVYLPRLERAGTDAGTPAAPPREMESGRGAGETLLLVEDEPGVRASARRILERLGYTVLEAANGRDALDTAARFAGRIAALVTDAVMPELGGRDLADALRRARPELRVLYMSGYTDDEMLRRGLLEPGCAFVEKPFTAEALGGAVQAVLSAVSR